MNYGNFVLFLIFASTVFGQIDSFALRAKFGAPLNRETFTVRPGTDMTVDYSPTSSHTCRLEFPGAAPLPRDVAPGVGVNLQQLQKLMDEVVEAVVPQSMRGKELQGMCEIAGTMSMCSKNYEHVAIRESFNARGRTAVVVTFKAADCSGDR
jgi:hypothetical protein